MRLIHFVKQYCCHLARCRIKRYFRVSKWTYFWKRVYSMGWKWLWLNNWNQEWKKVKSKMEAIR